MNRQSELKRTKGLARSTLRAQSQNRSTNGKAANAAARRKRADDRLDGDRAFRRAVLERDGARCRCCGRTGTEAHHAAERSTHPALRHEPAIGLTLCHGCHAWTHANVAAAVERGLLVPGWMQRLEDAADSIGPTGPCRCHG